MIRASVTYCGALVDKPITRFIDIDENMVAAEMPLPSGKTRKITAGELFQVFFLKKSYITENVETETALLPEHFELWIREKYLKKTNIYDKIIRIDYTRL